MDFKQIEQKWKSRWAERGLFQADPDSSKPKFYVVVAYPYPSGAMHIGHARTYIFPDVLVRYKKMRGYNALLPMGWHVTGTPVLAACEKVKEKDPQTLHIMTEVFKIPESDLKYLEEPKSFVDYFVNKAETGYKKSMDALGLAIDWRRELVTIEPQYQKFIEWQYLKLREKGYVIQKEFPVRYCPKDRQPVGDHDLAKGEGVGITEFTLLKAKFGDGYLVAATLRPETVFGQTNFWANPDVVYVKARINGEVWILSKECAQKLKYQRRKVEILGEIKGTQLIGKKCIAPMINREIPILPASFADPNFGTGLVTSVPSDAPYDWIALKELQEKPDLCKKYGLNPDEIRAIKPIPIIETKDWGKLPALKIVEDMGIKNQRDPRLEEATKKIYKAGFYGGVMLENCGEYAGLSVEAAKERVKQDLIAAGQADTFYELEDEVICRCGARVIVAILPDQWFLKYSDEDWKEQVRAHFSGMEIVPELQRQNFAHTISWLEDKPCTRLRGLGTKLPWDKKWIIEPLADSTIYFAYFTISHLIKKVPPEKLDEEIFDYIFQGKGDVVKLAKQKDIDQKLLEEMRAQFDYFYPLNFNISASELIPNHMTFTIFHHVAIFPSEKRLKGEICLGMGTLEGEKMSSSKGNVILVRDIVDRLGADMVRLFLMSFVEPWEDFDWQQRTVDATLKSVQKYYSFFLENARDKPLEKELSHADRWILSRINQTIEHVTNYMESFLFRKALQTALFEFMKDFKWYKKRTQPKPGVTAYIIKILAQLLAPFTPFICEEIWERAGGRSSVFESSWPKVDKSAIDQELEKRELQLKQTIEKVKKLKNFLQKKKKITKVLIYTVPEEKDFYSGAIELLKAELGVDVEVYASNDPKRYDPAEKAVKAKPGAPAFYIE